MRHPGLECVTDQDVHLRMSENPEEVLPEQWVGARGYVKERRAEVSLE